MTRARGLRARLLSAHLLVVVICLAAVAIIAGLVGPGIFHTHLRMAGVAERSAELVHAERAFREANAITLLAALGAGLACAAVAAAALSRAIGRPLTHLTGAARSLAQGETGARAREADSVREVADLARTFNAMADRLERSEVARRRMLADLAHEMATPVSVIAAYVEGVDDGVVPYDASVSEVLTAQLARLSRLIADLDDLSRADEGRMDLSLKPTDVGEVLLGCIAARRAQFDASGVGLSGPHAPGAITVTADRQRLAQIVDNLLANALRHTPPGGTVDVMVRAGAGAVRVDVADTGDGLAPSQAKKVFERFYRGDTARDRESSGSGIGLTISRALARAHGGELNAHSAGPGRGARFTLTLPR